MKHLTIFLLFSLLALSAFASEGASTVNGNGAAKALEEGEFTLTEKAEKRLGVQWLTLSGDGPWKVPAEAVMRIKFTKTAYRKFEGRITMVILEVIKEESGYVWISSPDLVDGDEVAVKGVKFLRLTELDLFQGAVDSCG